MPAALKIKLTEEEELELLELKKDPKTPQRTKERIEALRLNAKGWKVEKIADYLDQAPNTVRRTIYCWISTGKEGLFDQKRKGRKRKWENEDIEYLEECLDKEERTYNSYQLKQKLFEERKIELSADRIRRILKKRGESGNEQKVALKI